MQSDRIGPPDAVAFSSRRVVGLGAPLTVIIRAPRGDIPLLRTEVNRLQEEHGRQRPDGHSDQEQWVAEQAAWLDMLRQLDDDRDPEVELTWPTAYAAPVLRGAVASAQRAAQAAPQDVQAHRRLESATATLGDFLAVDNGGLARVNL